jgi:hypothetical protein
MVDITGIDPDPAWMDTPVTVQATAAFSADGREQEQAVLGWIPEFRWKWEYLSDGTVTSSEPALDPQAPGWSEWSPLNSATGVGAFPTGLVKQVKVTTQVRMAPAVGAPSAAVCQGVAMEALTVWELRDVTNLHVVRFEEGSVTLAWDPADCPGVAGYKYHIEPARDTLTDVGTNTQVTIPNMTVGQTYTVGVHTYDALGHMTHTAYVTFTVASSPPPVPVVYVFPAPSGTAVDVLWAPSPGPNIIRYEIDTFGASTALVDHDPNTQFHLARIDGFEEGEPVAVLVRAFSASLAASTWVARSVTAVPFFDLAGKQKDIEDKCLALLGGPSGASWPTGLNTPAVREQLRATLQQKLSGTSFVDNSSSGPVLSYWVGYDNYGNDQDPSNPAHFTDTAWTPITIPVADWETAPDPDYVKPTAVNEIATECGRVTPWVLRQTK